ncbi:phage portal protein [Mucilaginibacter sp.]|uniref:phage portal protein n=1 Tax=Mucilaginibacter sp. TaxID=1882438 RepID=UPI003D0B98F6
MINTGNTESREIVRFNQHVTPPPVERIQSNSDKVFVRYGIDNLYPNFLLKLFNECPLHKGIINSKIDYIIGDGLTLKGGDKDVKFKPNPSDNFNEFISKIINDYLIFNYYAIEVVYNKLNKPIQYNHIPAHKIRCNKDRSKFWYSNDWFFDPNILLSYDIWTANSNPDGKSKVFFFTSYAPSVNNIYPTPDYSGAIKSIETDIAIRDFQINSIENSFSVSSIITFLSGSPNDEVKRQITNKIQNSFTGQNGGKMIIGFENATSLPPDVKNIAPSDWDKAYIEVKKDVIQDILTAHSAVSPMLFGIKTDGQLGGATELETAYEIFKNLFVKNRRNELESGLNRLFAEIGLGELEFKDKGSLFAATLSDAMKMKTYTINEIRAEAGLPDIENGNRLIDEVKPVPTQEPATDGKTPDVNVVGSPVPANTVETPPAPAGAVPSTGKGFNSDLNTFSGHLTDDDFEKVKHIGLKKKAFRTLKKLDYSVQSFSDVKAIELAFDDEKDISDYLIKNGIKNMSLTQIKAAIRKDLGIAVTADEIRKIITGLEDSGVINKADVGKGITINPTEKSMQPALENIRRVEVRYSYEGPEDDKNRPFCAKLMANDKYYTREDIQQMSSLFGYSIFDYRGGFYHNPNTNTTTPFCRHRWVANSVVKINAED